MGSGNTKPKEKPDVYTFRFENATVVPKVSETVRLKKPPLKKHDSSPNLISSTTLFSPYVDVQVGKDGESGAKVQRNVSKDMKTKLGGGTIDYKFSNFYQFNTSLPWLLKNAYFTEPSIKDFQVTRVIGKGKTGDVRIAKTANNKYMVIKTIAKEYIFSKKEERHIMNEREIFYHLDSPFCIKLFAEFEDRTNVYFAMEYVPGGELYRCLELQTVLPQDVAKFYLTEIFAALEHIHSIGYVYRDLKPENIAIDEDGHIKIVDFGSAIRNDNHASGKLYTNCTSVPYMSPEQMNGKFSGGYTKIVDWWAYGILAYEIQVGHTPYCQGKETEYEILLKILKNKVNFPSTVNPKTRSLITDLLQSDPKVRITDPRRIKDHDYFNDVKHWGNVYERHLVPPFVPELGMDGDSHYFILNEEKSAKNWKSHSLETLVKMF